MGTFDSGAILCSFYCRLCASVCRLIFFLYLHISVLNSNNSIVWWGWAGKGWREKEMVPAMFFFSFSIFLFLFLMWRGEWRRGCRLVMWSGQRWQPWHPCHSSTSSQCNQEQYALCTHCAKKSRSEKCWLQGNWLAMSSLDKDLQFLSVCHHKAKPNCLTKPYLILVSA